ncbi:MAG TPA: AAA family ATPase [Streptosporangiaceae bacterium]|nr:AAA family ATPase [Streptosporangiaceae bacterium]
MADDDLQVIHGLVRDALAVLTIQSTRGIYPYAVTNDQALRLGLGSMSTNAMICYAIASLQGLLPQATAAVGPDRATIGPALSRKLHDCMKLGIQAMISRINESDQAIVKFFTGRRGDAEPYDSGTFGKQDPFTLTWLVELLRVAAADEEIADPEAVLLALDATTKVAEVRTVDVLDHPNQPVLIPDKKEEQPLPHPLPLVRVVQLYKLLGRKDERALASASQWFSDLLYKQMSLRSIEHAAFDPAMLVFALEGMLETSPLRVTRPIIKSFTACIETTRQVDLTLRGITPFKATESGAVHFFVGVEVFMSLLRIAHSREKVGDVEFFEQIKPAMHDYLQWLQANFVTGRATLPLAIPEDSYPADTQVDYLGWQSEYAPAGDPTIHTWMTSQVILLLHGYETLLRRSLAREELKRVGLAAVDCGQSAKNESSAERLDRARDEDPLDLGESSPYRVISRLTESFVNARLDGDFDDVLYSCLLYGPPGTGKTTLARRLAKDLGWPLLIVSTGDFIVRGEAQVEARAKDIFHALTAQRNVVVFFDEIDRLLLDRDTRAYESQGDMLQIMTPSMLTKINDLRQAERVIIVIATNYAERIDRAIKRPGRVDQQLLVLPPGLAQRQRVIRNYLKRRGDSRAADSELILRAAKEGTWLTITEIETATRYSVRSGTDLVEAVKAVEPAITLDNYMKRDEFTTKDQVPAPELLEEALLLAYLLIEGKTGQEWESIASQYNQLGRWWSAVGRAAVVRDQEVSEALGAVF